MTPERDLARLRATYADLLDPDDDPALVRFLGELEALHTAPRVPRAAGANAARPARRWVVHETGPLSPLDLSHSRERPTATGQPARSGWWPRLARAANIAAAAVLILGLIAASALLLRGGATPAATATPIATARLLYPGLLDGRAGIIAANADGSEARLLVEGTYHGVAPAPDGRRFLAFGFDTTGLAVLYAADGQPLRRYDLGGDNGLLANWSPDSRTVALFTRPPLASDLSATKTWLLDEHGAKEVRLGIATAASSTTGGGVWSAQGRLLLAVVPGDGDGDGQITFADPTELWTVDASGGDARRLYRGKFVAVGWSGQRAEIYVIESARLLAITDPTGAQRVVASADDLARRLLAPEVARGEAFSLSMSVAANLPRADRLVIALDSTRPPGPGASASLLLVLDGDGQVLNQGRVEAGTRPNRAYWAPDGTRLAYSYYGADDTTGGVRVVAVDRGGTVNTVSTFADLDGASVTMANLRWSPDSRTLAFFRFTSVWRGITVIDGLAADTSWAMPSEARGWPGWLPGPGR